MEDITKHTIKIVKSVRNPTTTLRKKIAEVLTEILIITFAVSLAQFLERQRENDVKQREVTEFLSGLKVDLENDVSQAREVKSIYGDFSKAYTYLSNVPNSTKYDTDSLNMYVNQISNNAIFKPNLSRFEGFKSSGKLEEITDKKLLQDILTFYEQTAPSLNLSQESWVGLQHQLSNLAIVNQITYKNGTNNNYQFISQPQAHNLCKRLIPWSQLYERYDAIINLGQTIVQEIDKANKG